VVVGSVPWLLVLFAIKGRAKTYHGKDWCKSDS
jgi:hypothetical protein